MWIHEFFSFLVTKPTCLSLSSTNNPVCLSPRQWYKSKYLYNFSILWCDVGVQSNEPNLCHVKQSRELLLGPWHLGHGQMVPRRKPCKGPLTNVGQSSPLHYLATLEGGGPKALPLLPALSRVPEQDDHPCRPSKTSHDQPHRPPSTRTASTPPEGTMPSVCAGIPALPPSKPRSHLNSPESTRAVLTSKPWPTDDYSGTHFCGG